MSVVLAMIRFFGEGGCALFWQSSLSQCTTSFALVYVHCCIIVLVMCLL